MYISEKYFLQKLRKISKLIRKKRPDTRLREVDTGLRHVLQEGYKAERGGSQGWERSDTRLREVDTRLREVDTRLREVGYKAERGGYRAGRGGIQGWERRDTRLDTRLPPKRFMYAWKSCCCHAKTGVFLQRYNRSHHLLNLLTT